MKDNFKSKVVKLTLSGIAIFIFGIFIGYQLNNGTIASIQGFLFNAAGWATDPNATNSNATNANATNSNATNSNATNANATNSNATNNIIYLQNFNLITKQAQAGDKVYVSVKTSGAYLNGATVTLKNKTTNATFTAAVKSIDNNPYIVLPTNLSTATYIVTDVLLTGLNNDKTTFSKQYSSSGIDNYWNFTDTVSINEKSVENPIKLNSISINSSEASVGDKVNLSFDVNKALKSLKLEFKTNDGKILIVYVQSLTSESYFEIPTTTTGGTYTLYSATLIASDSTKVYTIDGSNGSEKFAFNSTLLISDKENTSSFIYNNEDINSQILSKLHDSKNGTEIIVNANSNTLIDKELFNAIKGKNKILTINYNDNQIVFKGTNIRNSKTIDISMMVGLSSLDENIGKLVPNGVVINFPDNGNLPGSALIRIKASDEITNTLGDKIYVYFYNESTNDFCVIAEDVKKTSDGYYEFTISHNSDYLLVNEKLDSKLVVTQSSEDIVTFQKGNKTYLLLIGIGAVAVIATASVIVVVRKKNKNK